MPSKIWKPALAALLAFIGTLFIQASHSLAPTNAVVKEIPKIVQQTTTHTETTHAYITRVIDGDTIELSTGEHVRYIGIDTPELYPKDGTGKQCYSGEAAARNTELVFQKEVTLVPDKENTDKYQRLLRYVYVGDTFVNHVLVSEGYAYAKEYPPNTSKHAELTAAMQEAQSAKRGLWVLCTK